MSASSSQALEYLEGLTGATHKRLYQQPSAVLAVFRRMLPHLGSWPCHSIRTTARTNPICSEDDCYGNALHDRAFPSSRA